ncbi:carboxypeptidase regulatory-like domain-containing protein [Pseudomonas sp. N040]|uniref:carboxypeptidase regulatory-like domain-containing protein n=1 Tax=Pseudomonas sp. N040 TaxID=2785325 RepID=UPI0018A28E0F|nr:carboxypeptidase regulatory-like domain-containing protein [Pseudomonas sp. N040]MBF7729101.1 carboxypeptidase regulatory-like domain-containing protein [Pseudomonas sp. N040]MBW7012741.1 carboxypeptidase regulatory-like domain-containing protein [Pseudomonas sp. N040]
MNRSFVLPMALSGLVLGSSLPALAGTISGTVTAGDKPVAGALVTLWNAEKNRKETVYTDDQGHYTLNTGFTGKLVLRARTPYFKDVKQDLELAADTSSSVDFAVEKIASLDELSASFPASAHAATLKFPDDQTKAAFINQCNYCHQQGNALTRMNHTPEQWNSTVWRMEGYGAYITHGEHKRIARMMDETYDGKPVNAIQTQDYAPELAKARIEEWHAATPMSFLHDTIVGSDEKLYGIDEAQDIMYILDRETGKIEQSQMPANGNPVGGDFAGLQLPIGIFTGNQGPHSAVETADGRMFITGALSSSLIMFRPATKEWKVYEIPRGFLWRKGLYPHTIRADKEGNIWFTAMSSNRLVKFDIKTEQFTDIALPSNGVMRWLTDTFMGVILKVAAWFPQQNVHLALSHHKWLNGGIGIFNWPYGIDVNPVDGGIWYSKLLSNKIGHVDPKTLEVTEYDVPHKGPRRLRFDKDGMLWIPSFDEGKLMKFDPATKQFETIDLPLLAQNEYEIPYALNVDARGDVWIATNQQDRIARYIPSQKKFVMYAMPNRVIWFRDFEFTKDGKVCTSNSNLPAYAHEDGLPAFFCIQPDVNDHSSLIPAHQLPVQLK